MSDYFNCTRWLIDRDREMRELMNDGIQLETIGRYMNLNPRVCALRIRIHTKVFPIMPPFDGDNELWRDFCADRWSLAIAGRVSFFFRSVDD